MELKKKNGEIIIVRSNNVTIDGLKVGKLKNIRLDENENLTGDIEFQDKEVEEKILKGETKPISFIIKGRNKR
jgi:sporulation protein YlmC with PRC-barrel domain